MSSRCSRCGARTGLTGVLHGQAPLPGGQPLPPHDDTRCVAWSCRSRAMPRWLTNLTSSETRSESSRSDWAAARTGCGDVRAHPEEGLSLVDSATEGTYRPMSQPTLWRGVSTGPGLRTWTTSSVGRRGCRPPTLRIRRRAASRWATTTPVLRTRSPRRGALTPSASTWLADAAPTSPPMRWRTRPGRCCVTTPSCTQRAPARLRIHIMTLTRDRSFGTASAGQGSYIGRTDHGTPVRARTTILSMVNIKDGPAGTKYMFA